MNFMPFGQLKSFFKISIEVQYDHTFRQQKTRNGKFRSSFFAA